MEEHPRPGENSNLLSNSTTTYSKNNTKTTKIMGCLISLSIGLLGVAIWSFAQGNWKMGLAIIAIDFVISWIGGYIMIQKDKR